MKERKEKSQYISCVNERLQTIKETCDLIRQLQASNSSDGTEEKLMELDILMDRLCLCDIPNLPAPLNRNSIRTWMEEHAAEEIEHLEACLKIASNQEIQRTDPKTRSIHPQTRGKWLDLHFKTSPPRCQAMRLMVKDKSIKIQML